MKHNEILDNWFERVWVNEEESAIHELFRPKSNSDKAYGLKTDEGLDPDSYLEFHRSILKLIDITDFRIDSFLSNDTMLYSECTMQFSARNRGSGVFSIRGCVVAKIEDGKVVSANNYFDFLQLFSLIGITPQDSMEKCLCGMELSF